MSAQIDRAFGFALFSVNDNSKNKLPLFLLNVNVQCVVDDESFLSMYMSQSVTEKFGACAQTGEPRSTRQPQSFVANVLDGNH